MRFKKGSGLFGQILRRSRDQILSIPDATWQMSFPMKLPWPLTE
jgi:hypothetical protein